jgi:hypothetical protein
MPQSSCESICVSHNGILHPALAKAAGVKHVWSVVFTLRQSVVADSYKKVIRPTSSTSLDATTIIFSFLFNTQTLQSQQGDAP